MEGIAFCDRSPTQKQHLLLLLANTSNCNGVPIRESFHRASHDPPKGIAIKNQKIATNRISHLTRVKKIRQNNLERSNGNLTPQKDLKK